jgi:hypothetical protein
MPVNCLDENPRISLAMQEFGDEGHVIEGCSSQAHLAPPLELDDNRRNLGVKDLLTSDPALNSSTVSCGAQNPGDGWR